MGALDKLNAKAKEQTEKKEHFNNGDSEKNESKPAERDAEKQPKTTENNYVSKQKKTRKGTRTKKAKHPGGRPNTRGKYKMVNIAIPEDVYDRLKEVCNGNMTYYLNDIIRKNIKM